MGKVLERGASGTCLSLSVGGFQNFFADTIILNREIHAQHKLDRVCRFKPLKAILAEILENDDVGVQSYLVLLQQPMQSACRVTRPAAVAMTSLITGTGDCDQKQVK